MERRYTGVNMKKSIKTNLIMSFMLVIVITVGFLIASLLNGIKIYYYNNMEDILTNQIRFSTDFYSKYFSASGLDKIIIDDIDIFLQNTSAQVQILDTEGKILMDSIGVSNEKHVITPDIISAIDNKKGVWNGFVPYDDEPVLAVSLPLRFNDNTIGIVRFISSLENTNKIIRGINIFLILMGSIVIIFSGLVSLILANSIVKPLQEITEVAEKMANGQFKVRSNLRLQNEIGRLSDTFNYMAEEIVRKEQLKNDFISSISHELRTPLTSIKGWAVTIRDDDIPRDILLDGLNIIEKESDRLTLMVEELLDFSRFTSGRIRLEKDSFNIYNTIKTIATQLQPRAKNNGIDFVVNIHEDLNYIFSDENRIKQVLINILDNAFKFTGDKGKVIMNALKDVDNIVIEIIDNGIGIPEHDMPYIFEKFYKGKNSQSHSGLGLSISHEIVTLHGGTLKIESKEGQGTKVIVTLPLTEVVV